VQKKEVIAREKEVVGVAAKEKEVVQEKATSQATICRNFE